MLCDMLPLDVPCLKREVCQILICPSKAADLFRYLGQCRTRAVDFGCCILVLGLAQVIRSGAGYAPTFSISLLRSRIFCFTSRSVKVLSQFRLCAEMLSNRESEFDVVVFHEGRPFRNAISQMRVNLFDESTRQRADMRNPAGSSLTVPVAASMSCRLRNKPVRQKSRFLSETRDRHRPQHQLHQRLRLGLPFLRLLPAPRRAGRLRPGLGRAGGQAPGAQGPRRQRGAPPGRAQSGAGAGLLREAHRLHPRRRPGGPRLFAAGGGLLGGAMESDHRRSHPALD